MKALGFEYEDDGAPEYPSNDVGKEIKAMTSELKDLNVNQIRVLPDRNAQGQFTVAYREKNGGYSNIKDGFESREDADRYRKSIIESSMALSEDAQSLAMSH